MLSPPSSKKLSSMPDPLQPQHLGKQPAQHLLLRRARRAPPSRRRKLRRRQRPPVELAVRRQRQTDPAPRTPTAPCSPAGSPDSAPATPPHRHRCAGARHHIAHQPLAPAAILARNHRRLRHRRPAAASAASISPGSIRNPRSFTCCVRTPQKLQHPVRTPARQVPGAVHPAPRTHHTDRPQTAPPSDPHDPDSPAPDPLPQCKARPQPRPEQAPGRRPTRKPACSRSDDRSGCVLLGGFVQYKGSRVDAALGRTIGIDNGHIAKSSTQPDGRRRPISSPPTIVR